MSKPNVESVAANERPILSEEVAGEQKPGEPEQKPAPLRDSKEGNELGQKQGGPARASKARPDR